MPIPTYGGEAKTLYSYETTVGEPAYMTEHMGSWYIRNGETWKRYDSSVFREGTYQYHNQVRIDDGSETYKLSETTRVFIDGSEWTISPGSITVEPTYSMSYYVSPNYVVTKIDDYELTFYGSDRYNIGANYIGTPIEEFSVSDGVLGGVGSYTFSKDSGPAWINVSSAGVVSGTPTVVGSNSNLVVRVTDEASNTKTISITVRETYNDPNLRTVVENVVITSNMEAPVYGGEVKTYYTYETVSGEPAYMTPHMGAWYKENGTKYTESTFKPGRYYYFNQIRVDGNAGHTHMLSNSTTLTVDGNVWTISTSGATVEPTYSMAYYKSPIYEVPMVSINEVNVTGIVAPVGGKTPDVSGITTSTPGVRVREASWHEENWDDVTTFVASKRYMLIVIFELEEGYIFAPGFDESNVNLNTTNQLMSEFVGENPDIRIFYEATQNPKITKAPTVKVKNANNNSVLISWNEVQYANKYEVYRSENKKKWTKVKTTTDLSFTNTGLTYGKTYYYKVKAINAISNKTSSVVSGKATPNKMNIRLYGVGTNNIKVAWDKVNVTGYEIYRSEDNKKWTKVTTITKNSTLNYNNKKLKANKKYYYKARAYKTVSGKKVYGSYSDVAYTRTAPVTPTLKVSIKNYDAMNVSIGEAKGAAIYRLEKSLDGSTYTLVEEFPNNGTVAQDSQELGKTYYFRLRACNSYGKCSAWATASLKQTTKTPGFTLKTSSKKVTVNVNKVNGADGYEIYRSTKKNGKYTLVKTITSEEEVLQYVDKTKKGNYYYYKVRSYRLNDESKKVFSKISGIKSIRSK